MITVLHMDTGRSMRGGQRQVALLIRMMYRLGPEQYLACPSESPLLAGCTDYIKEHYPLPLTNAGRFLDRKNLRRFIEEKRIGIIHAHDSHAHSLLAFLRISAESPGMVVTRRSSGEIGFGSRAKYLSHNIRYIAISEHIRRQLCRGGVPSERVKVLPSMVDLDAFEGIRAGNAVVRTGKVVLSAGIFDPQKGYQDALAAIRNLRAIRKGDFRYFLYGDGREKRKLAGYVDKWGLNDVVSMPGWHPEPLEYLSAVDIFLSPSHREGLNSSILEAMAAGLPVLATDIPPHREMIEDGQTGLLFPPGDIDKMVEKLNCLLDDKALALSLKNHSLTASKRFDAALISRMIYGLYNDMAACR